jgi:hypothetical protein
MAYLLATRLGLNLRELNIATPEPS